MWCIYCGRNLDTEESLKSGKTGESPDTAAKAHAGKPFNPINPVKLNSIYKVLKHKEAYEKTFSWAKKRR